MMQHGGILVESNDLESTYTFRLFFQLCNSCIRLSEAFFLVELSILYGRRHDGKYICKHISKLWISIHLSRFHLTRFSRDKYTFRLSRVYPYISIYVRLCQFPDHASPCKDAIHSGKLCNVMFHLPSTYHLEANSQLQHQVHKRSRLSVYAKWRSETASISALGRRPLYLVLHYTLTVGAATYKMWIMIPGFAQCDGSMTGSLHDCGFFDIAFCLCTMGYCLRWGL